MRETNENINGLSRRRFCKSGLITLAGLTLPTPLLANEIRLPLPERQLSFVHLHTGETLNGATYWENGAVQRAALADIYHILRDHRSGESVEIDLNLLDQLVLLNQKLDNRKPLHIISGFRSQKTNQYLRSKSQGGGVAKYSLHMDGRAIDIRIPGYNTTELYKTAASLRAGGVGFYPGLKFIHMDTGQVKYWQG